MDDKLGYENNREHADGQPGHVDRRKYSVFGYVAPKGSDVIPKHRIGYSMEILPSAQQVTRFELSSYSYRRELTGLEAAAFHVWDPMVSKPRPNMPIMPVSSNPGD